MGLSTVVSKISETLSRRNVRYFVSEAAATGTGWITATGTSHFLQTIGAPDEVDTVGTYVLKTLCYIGANVGTYAFLHQRFGEQNTSCKEELKDMINSNIAATKWHAVLSMGGHYVGLKSGLLPKEWVAAVVYPVVGTGCFIYKQVLNHKNGLFSLPKLRLPWRKQRTLEERVDSE